MDMNIDDAAVGCNLYLPVQGSTLDLYRPAGVTRKSSLARSNHIMRTPSTGSITQKWKVVYYQWYVLYQVVEYDEGIHTHKFWHITQKGRKTLVYDVWQKEVMKPTRLLGAWPWFMARVKSPRPRSRSAQVGSCPVLPSGHVLSGPPTDSCYMRILELMDCASMYIISL